VAFNIDGLMAVYQVKEDVYKRPCVMISTHDPAPIVIEGTLHEFLLRLKQATGLEVY